MARIVGVHGIAQQVRGPEVLRAAWVPALRDGVALSGAEPPDAAELEIAFYGDLFRARGGKAVGDPLYVATDVEEGFEQELLEAWRAEAAATDDVVCGPGATAKLRTPKTVQRDRRLPGGGAAHLDHFLMLRVLDIIAWMRARSAACHSDRRRPVQRSDR
jgi:hypothetical protein